MSTLINQHVVFFANASSTVGAGHVMRLLSLAQAALKRGIRVSFASYECPEFLRNRLSNEGCNIVSLPFYFTLKHLTALKATVIVIDDYRLDDQQWRSFKKTHALLVNIDDEINNKALISDIIINPAANATQSNYQKRAPQASYCLGPSYTLLRKEFIEEGFIDVEQRKQILVTLGGADVKNMSLALAQALVNKPFDDVDICVLLGGLNTLALAPLLALAKVHNNLLIVEKSQHVAQLMMQSGLAITAAGGTLGELACVGTPSIALVSVDNQKAALSSSQSNNWYFSHDVRSYKEEELKPSDTNFNTQIIDEITAQAHELWRDLCKRKHMSTQARQLIDGHGCDRIVEQILLSL